MSQKDYRNAATLAQRFRDRGPAQHTAVVDAFVAFFTADNTRFDADCFRAASFPGANVNARPARKSRTS